MIKNRDVRASHFRDIDRMRAEQYGKSLAVFNSVDEIFFFLENIFTAGLDEKHIGMALDVFLRDFGQFEEKDLENETFKKFVRELGINQITFTKEENYVKTARFLDWFIVDDATLWVNLEMNLFNKEHMFSPKSLIVIAGHFAAQQEGSQNFYDFLENQYNGGKFAKVETHDLITLAYAFYQVHAGSKAFMNDIAGDLNQRLNDRTSTYDLLRVLQAYSEISKDVVGLFVQLETLFLRRIEQMTVDELTTCASGFSISGYGTPYFQQVLEKALLENVGRMSTQSLKEVCRGFLYSQRGSRQLHQMLLPRLRPILSAFSSNELCYMLYSFHNAKHLPKQFAKDVEAFVKVRLSDTEAITI